MLVIDRSRHLLFELYSSTYYGGGQPAWFATQESVWNRRSAVRNAPAPAE